MDKVIQKTIGDTVCRIHKTADFTILSNGFIGSTNISCQAILLLAQAMSLPQNWNFTVKGLEKICTVGETAVRNMLKELETWGYLVRTKLMPSKETHGRIKYIYDFYEYSAKDTSVPQADVVMETYTAENATLYKVKKDSHKMYQSLSDEHPNKAFDIGAYVKKRDKMHFEPKARDKITRFDTHGSAVKEVTKSDTDSNREKYADNGTVSEEAVNKRETAEAADNFTLF